MKRKLLTLMLILASILCLTLGLAACGNNGGTTDQNNGPYDTPQDEEQALNFRFDSKTETYTVVESNVSGDVVIPSAYQGKPVTAIDEEAFRECHIRSIQIPESVTSIGYLPFVYCYDLETIQVAQGNPVYHSDGNCIIETKSKTLIAGCKSSTIPADGSVTSIGEGAFYYCGYLTSITVPGCVTSIGNEAFRGCSRLTSITVSNGVTSIGEEAFSFCASLTDIKLPDNAVKIGANVLMSTAYFDDKSNWDSDNVLYIGNHLIRADYTLSGAYTVRANTKSIADSAFGVCSLMTSISIPESVTSIGSGIFPGSDSFESIEVAQGNPVYHSDGNCIIETESGILVTGCSKSVIPNGVTSIGREAFCGCSGLTSITIPESVTSIGDMAFYNCRALRTDLEIPAGVTEIGIGAFSGCSARLTVAQGNPVYHSEGNCVIETESKTLAVGRSNSVIPDDGSVTSIGEEAFSNNKEASSMTIPGSITEIGDRAFSGSVFRSIELSGGLTKIGQEAFYDCRSLTSIQLPDSLTSIGEAAFQDCTSLESVTFGEKSKLTSVGDFAFYNCKALASIEIPDSLASIGDWAFYGCTSLTSATFGEKSNLTSVGDSAFNGCNRLTSIALPESVTEIGERAFEGCSSLESVTFGENSKLISIGDFAFYNCRSLASIEIPKSVTKFGQFAFAYCNSLTSIGFKGTVNEWNAIKKGYSWDNETGNYTVTCTDGTAAKTAK